MGLEAANFIPQLQPLNPDGADDINRGDDHLRMIKGVLQNQFPNFTNTAVTASCLELNNVTGSTSNLQTQINTKAPINSPALTGTPTTPTPSGSTGAQIANVTYVQTSVAGVGTLGDLVPVNVSSSGTITLNTREKCEAVTAITRTVPSGAAVDSVFGYKDNGQNFSINKLTIVPPSGHRFEWGAVDEPMEITTRGEAGVLAQTSAGVWRFIA